MNKTGSARLECWTLHSSLWKASEEILRSEMIKMVFQWVVAAAVYGSISIGPWFSFRK